MANVWDTSPLEGRSLLIELALADFANDQGKCFPSIETVARKARCSESWVHQVIRDLKRRGRIEVILGGGRGNVNLYILTPNAGEKGVTNTPLLPVKGAVDSVERVQSVKKRVHPTAPRTVLDPSIEPVEDEPPMVIRRNIFVLYDNYMGRPSVTPTMREVLIQAEEDYPDECITHCFLTAARSSDGRRSWKYVESILKRHQAEGCNERKPVGRNAAPAHAPLDSAAALAAAYPSIQYWPEHLGVDGGGADAGLAPVDGGNDPPRLEVRR